MPGYNESANIGQVIQDTLPYCNNLVVVDDGSRDNTSDIARNKLKYVIRHSVNMGKGAALKTGADFAIEKGAKKLIFIDSDGQHEPKEIPRFFSLLDDYDIIFGSRRFDKNMPGIFRIGNFFLTNYIYLLYGVKIRDTQSGYRAVSANAYKKIRWKATGYGVESEMIANVGKSGLKYKETDISTIYKNRHKGTTVFDGIKIAWYMTLYRLQR
jgi:glycosyltransferase involved in cell wall biosynthesis